MKMQTPVMESVRFENEDVVAASIVLTSINGAGGDGSFMVDGNPAQTYNVSASDGASGLALALLSSANGFTAPSSGGGVYISFSEGSSSTYLFDKVFSDEKDEISAKYYEGIDFSGRYHWDPATSTLYMHRR